MGCFDHMIKYLSNKKDYDFDSHEESAEALRRANVGNPTDPTEPFSEENYQSWANNLKQLGWSSGLMAEDLKKAREDWIASVLSRSAAEIWESSQPCSKKHSVKIIWGSDWSDSGNSKPCSYSFNTKAELEAFLKGVDEASGWLDYDIVEENDHD